MHRVLSPIVLIVSMALFDLAYAYLDYRIPDVIMMTIEKIKKGLSR